MDEDGNPSVEYQEYLGSDNYYPFGMKFSHNNVILESGRVAFVDFQGGLKNRYTYNGKEFLDDLGINWHYYGFRVYDPAIGRFTSVDPIAEDFAFVSGFNYAENKPINSIDLHGLQSFQSINASFHSGEGAKFQKSHPKTAAAIAAAPAVGLGLGYAVARYGVAGVASFAANEVKDEVASQVTGGATDILDATKMGAKLMKEGVSTIYRAVSKGELDDIANNEVIRPGPNSMETKLFAENVDDAVAQGVDTGKDFHVISVDVPTSTMNKLGVNTTIDKHMMQGNTITVDPDQYDLLNSTRGKVKLIDPK